MQVISTPAEMAALRVKWAQRQANNRLALVPTMGALHRGHGALCQLAKEKADRVVVSIFVNPLQFGANEDLDRYPRPKDADIAQCEAWGIDAVYYPSVQTMYPNGMGQTTCVLPPESVTNRLCGAARPGHFTGVATVVLALMNHIRPDCAVFGEKDAQQVMVIRRMVQDLGVPVDLLIHPVVRETNGLALSSRNQYLKSAAQRRAAGLLFSILATIREKMLASMPNSLDVKITFVETVQNVLDDWQQSPYGKEGVQWRLQYLEAVDEQSLETVSVLAPDSRLLIAAYVDETRLIDTLLL
jgi:pantoate--beta-alanine ligase